MMRLFLVCACARALAPPARRLTRRDAVDAADLVGGTWAGWQREFDVEGGTAPAGYELTSRERLDGDVLEIDFIWRFMPAGGASPEEVRERHRLLMLDTSTWVDHMQRALPVGTRVEIDHEGPIGRGLLVARLSRDGARGTG